MLLSPAPPPTIVSDTSEWNLASRALLSKYNRAIDAFQRAVKPLIDEVKLDTSDPLFTGDTPAAFLFMLNAAARLLRLPGGALLLRRLPARS